MAVVGRVGGSIPLSPSWPPGILVVTSGGPIAGRTRPLGSPTGGQAGGMLHVRCLDLRLPNRAHFPDLRLEASAFGSRCALTSNPDTCAVLLLAESTPLFFGVEKRTALASSQADEFEMRDFFKLTF